MDMAVKSVSLYVLFLSFFLVGGGGDQPLSQYRFLEDDMGDNGSGLFFGGGMFARRQYLCG